MTLGRNPDWIYNDLAGGSNGDSVILSIDFVNMGDNVHIAVSPPPSIVITVLEGDDPTPQANVKNGPNIVTITNANCGLQILFGPPVIGCIYEMIWTCTNTNGEQLARNTRITGI